MESSLCIHCKTHYRYQIAVCSGYLIHVRSLHLALSDDNYPKKFFFFKYLERDALLEVGGENNHSKKFFSSSNIQNGTIIVEVRGDAFWNNGQVSDSEVRGNAHWCVFAEIVLSQCLFWDKDWFCKKFAASFEIEVQHSYFGDLQREKIPRSDQFDGFRTDQLEMLNKDCWTSDSVY